VSTTEDDSNRATERNHEPSQPDLPGCGPGGRGFESRRSPLRDSCKVAQSAAPRKALRTDRGPRPRLLGDETELFQSFHRRLTRIVQRLVNTSPDIVDDVCDYAGIVGRLRTGCGRRLRARHPLESGDQSLEAVAAQSTVAFDLAPSYDARDAHRPRASTIVMRRSTSSRACVASAGRPKKSGWQ
jgi:hypothetical protein